MSKKREFKYASGKINMKKIGQAWRRKKAGKSPTPRRSTRKGQVRKTARRAYMPRKKAKSRSTGRRKKTMNLDVVGAAMGLAIPMTLIDGAEFAGSGFNATPELRTGRYAEALQQITSNLGNKAVRNKAISIGIGGLILKKIFSGLGVRKIGSLGPVNLNAK